MVRRKFFRRLIGSGQMTGHDALRTDHFIDRLAGIRIDDAVGRQAEAVGLDERLGEIDRV